MNIKERINEIEEDIKKYSPYPEKVKLIAVTKYINNEATKEVYESGAKRLGENKGQIFKEKTLFFKNEKLDVEWHFIGNLQKNKVKYIIEDVQLIHSVNKLSLAEEIDKRAKAIGRKVDVLLEVNIFGEESKQGYDKTELINDIQHLKELKNINIIGLMTMTPLGKSDDVKREVFQKLYQLKDEFNIKYFDGKLVELSMGMSDDYKIALEEGSTYIRIGSKLFE